ncbi:MAG TPA: FUSC family protein [Acidimicrobiales bacterium]
MLASCADRLIAAREAATDAAVADLAGGAGAHAPPVPESGGTDTVSSIRDIDPGFPVRMVAFAVEQLTDVALDALGARRHDAPLPDRLSSTVRSYTRVAAGHLTPRSVWFRNSLRGAVALAIAVAVAEATTVQHGFWVVLGTLSVLRSNVLGTGSTAVRAVAGTALGFVLGSAILVALTTHDTYLWAVLPVAVLVAGIAPSAISFTAGQAGFTVMVVVVFNIIDPVGSSVGLVRVEDVAIGTAVSVVVGLLFWPRGAAAELARTLVQGYEAATGWLVAAIDDVGREGPVGDGSPDRRRSTVAAQRLDDAYREFLSERGAKQVPLAVVTHLLTGCAAIRLSARTLEHLPVLAAPGAAPPIPEVVEARATVTASCRSMELWFCGVAGSLGDKSLVVAAPEPTDPRLHRELLEAWSAVWRAGRREGVFAVLRLLWVEERLDDLRQLQTELASTAPELF